jgi:hypothetical protein
MAKEQAQLPMGREWNKLEVQQKIVEDFLLKTTSQIFDLGK